MDWHVFLAVNVFFCVTIFYCNADSDVTAITFIDSSPIIFDEAPVREKRVSQQGNGMVTTRGNFQINGLENLDLPNIASHIRKGIQGVIESIANPISTEIIAQFEKGQGNFEGSQQNPPNEDTFNQVNQNGFSPSPNENRPPHHYPPGPPPFEHHPPPPYGPPPPFGPPPPPYGPPPYGHPPPPYGHPGPHGGGRHHPPPYGPPPPFGPPPHGPPPHGPPPHFGPPPPPYPYYNEYDQNNEYNNGDRRPDFSSQPNYPTGNVNHGSSKDDKHSEHTALNLDPYDVQTQEKSNIVGYIEHNFPVILLNENEIR